MRNGIRSVVLLTIAVCGSALAQRLPSHYPDSFQRTGTVDDISTTTIVINDIPYTLSNTVVVHSLTESRIAVARIRPDDVIGFEFGENRQIVEIWLLPDDYQQSRVHR